MDYITAPDPGACLLGAGELWYDRLTQNGQRTGYRHAGNVSQIAVRPAVQKAQITNYQDRDRGLYAEATTQQIVSMVPRFTEYNQHNLALLMAGDPRFYTQAATPVVDEVLAASPVKGLAYFTALREPGTITMTQGMTSLTEGDDWEFVEGHEAAGLIRLLPDGDVVDGGDPILIDYTPGTISGSSQPIVDMYTQGAIRCAWAFMPDPVYGPAWEVRWWVGAITPQEISALIGDDFSQSELLVNLLNDKRGAYGGSASSPYGRAFARPGVSS